MDPTLNDWSGSVSEAPGQHFTCAGPVQKPVRGFAPGHVSVWVSMHVPVCPRRQPVLGVVVVFATSAAFVVWPAEVPDSISVCWSDVVFEDGQHLTALDPGQSPVSVSAPSHANAEVSMQTPAWPLLHGEPGPTIFVVDGVIATATVVGFVVVGVVVVLATASALGQHLIAFDPGQYPDITSAPWHVYVAVSMHDPGCPYLHSTAATAGAVVGGAGAAVVLMALMPLGQHWIAALPKQ